MHLRLTLEGPEIEPGKIPFRDLKRLADLAQSGLERTARAVSGEDRGIRRTVSKSIREATELLLVGVEEGSAVAIAELKVPSEDTDEAQLLPFPAKDLGVRALEVFIDGLHSLETSESPAVPQQWDNSVMEIAEDLARFSKERAMILSFSTDAANRPSHVAHVRAEEAEKFAIRHQVEKRRRSVRGELVLIDLETGRIDVKEASGRRAHCVFPEEVTRRRPRAGGSAGARHW